MEEKAALEGAVSFNKAEQLTMNYTAKRNKRRSNKSWMLLILPALFLFIFMFIPLLQIIKLSITDAGGSFTLAAYLKFFQSSIYLQVIALTFKVAFVVTLLCLLLGYPVAYAMTKCSKRISSLIMIAVMIPFWTSLLVRTYAWMIILQSNGIINNILMGLGLIKEPLQLMNNTTGVYIGMTHILLPYMILSLYPVLSGIDFNYVSAAQNLGANKLLAFLRVYLPLSIQGIAAGSILVFVMGIGYFVTPSLLGGSNDAMISQLIQVQVSKLLNWQFSSAVSIILLAISLVVLYVSKKLMKVDKLW
ncbi:putative spermidine/putrescine transport system permease protein [Ruminiclostridium sufflavum DSM 19573]|uniref:Putative spermidine/putrescine transport system permease protein n=1 Tax=Ruminiclostridium sufflavum DSM 19573 TaxID=1121337 RepID=A0A318XQZ6_9FIRM|nr:ABC transporter permease [Ruminiclostridium sufflavum]PYG88739.1 putative spermidine/putrescine transport system permease protein [Ruminiclostridium sufflavum DSM 19573]